MSRALDPSRHLLVLGGTTAGVEGRFAAAARAAGIPVLGTIVTGLADPEEISPHLSHALVLEGQLAKKGPRLYRLVHEHGGYALFLGGGGIVADEIQIAVNLRIPFSVLDGAGGASEAYARRHPERAFTDPAALLSILLAPESWRPPRGYRHPGPNPSVDVIAVRGREVLLIQRDPDAPTEPGRWALPGGFVRTEAARGEAWRAGERLEDAAVRELEEETGLALDPSRLRAAGVYEGPGRDPRDTATSWSRAHVFTVELAADEGVVLAASADASDAQWWPLDALPRRIAFDHRRILAERSDAEPRSR